MVNQNELTVLSEHDYPWASLFQQLTLLVSCVVSPACAPTLSSRHPIRTALVDLTGEARSAEVYTTGPFPAQIAVHKQALSIGGLLNIPDVGQEFEFPGHGDVTTAVGIAVVQSYRLIGEAEAPEDPDAVTKVRAALEAVQAAALRATVVEVEIAEMEGRSGAERREGDDATISKLRTRRDEYEHELWEAQAHLRSVANTPGIVVAGWDALEKAGVDLEATDIAGLDYESEDKRSGFVILGGLRTVTLSFGEDFWWLINNLRQHEKKHIEQIGIVTQLIQARDVAYTSGLRIKHGLKLQAQVGLIGDGGKASEARISSYWSFAGQFSNAGNLPRVKWKREPVCMVCSLDLPGLAVPADRALQRHFGLHEMEQLDPASFQGWRTVSANITYMRDVWLFHKWKDHAAKYASERTMYSSPSCPYCRNALEGASIKNAAVVPGRGSS